MDDRFRLLSLRLAGLGLRTFSRLSPPVAGACAGFLWFTPLRKAADPKAADLAASSAVTWVHGLRLRTWGVTGPRVVFVHGWGGRWDQGAELIAALVDDGCRVSAFDFPGHGETPGLSTDVAQWIETLAAIDSGEPAVFVCHSFGFTAVANAVLRQGIAPRGVVAINPPLGLPFFLEAFRRKIRMPLVVVPHLVRAIERRVPGVRAITAVPVDRLSETVPLLYIADRSDREVPFDLHARAQALLGDRFVTTEGFGHNRILRSRQLIEVVREFVSEVQPEGQRRRRAKACPEPVLR